MTSQVSTTAKGGKVSTFYDEMRPRLYINPEAYKKVFTYAQIANPSEIGGIGVIEQDSVGDYILSDVFIVEQTIKGAECELSAEGLAKFLMTYHETGKDVGKLRCWWHSHCNMGVFWSGTDKDTILGWPSDFVVALVVNTKYEMEACLLVREPTTLVVQMVPQFDMRISNYDELEKEVKQLCSKTTTVVPYQGGYGSAPFQGQKKETKASSEVVTVSGTTKTEKKPSSTTKQTHTTSGTGGTGIGEWGEVVSHYADIEVALIRSKNEEEFYKFLCEKETLHECRLLTYCPAISCSNGQKCQMNPSVKRNIARRFYESEYVAYGWKVGGKTDMFSGDKVDNITIVSSTQGAIATVTGDVDDAVLNDMRDMGIIVVDERKEKKS